MWARSATHLSHTRVKKEKKITSRYAHFFSYHKCRLVIVPHAYCQLTASSRWIAAYKYILRRRPRNYRRQCKHSLNLFLWKTRNKVISDNTHELLECSSWIQHVYLFKSVSFGSTQPMGRLLDVIAHHLLFGSLQLATFRANQLAINIFEKGLSIHLEID